MSVDDNSLCDPKVTSLLIVVAFYGKEQLVKFKFLDGAISSESGLSKDYQKRLIKLIGHNFEIQHQLGLENNVADALSLVNHQINLMALFLLRNSTRMISIVARG